MLLNPKHRKKLNFIWGIVVVLIVISMILLYIPSIYR